MEKVSSEILLSAVTATRQRRGAQYYTEIENRCLAILASERPASLALETVCFKELFWFVLNENLSTAQELAVKERCLGALAGKPRFRYRFAKFSGRYKFIDGDPYDHNHYYFHLFWGFDMSTVSYMLYRDELANANTMLGLRGGLDGQETPLDKQLMLTTFIDYYDKLDNYPHLRDALHQLVVAIDLNNQSAGNYPLLYALKQGKFAAANKLIEYGARITPGLLERGLWVASRDNNVDLVRYLLANGAHGWKIHDDAGMSPLMYAMIKDDPSAEVLELLMQNAGDLAQTARQGRTPAELWLTAEEKLRLTVEEERRVSVLRLHQFTLVMAATLMTNPELADKLSREFYRKDPMCLGYQSGMRQTFKAVLFDDSESDPIRCKILALLIAAFPTLVEPDDRKLKLASVERKLLTGSASFSRTTNNLFIVWCFSIKRQLRLPVDDNYDCRLTLNGLT